jgi:hypothetical protein
MYLLQETYLLHTPKEVRIKIIDTMQLFCFNSDELVKSRFFHLSAILADRGSGSGAGARIQ